MTGPAKEPATRPAGWWKSRLIKLVLLGIAAVVLVGVVWFRPGTSFTPRPAPIVKALLPQPVALAPGVYLLGKTKPAAAYLVETSEGLVLVDSGLEDNTAAVTGQIAELGFDLKQLRAVLITHVHADHSLGAAHLRKLTGAKIYAGRADCPPLRKGGPRDAFFSIYDLPYLAPHPTVVDVELAGDEVIGFGETRFVAVATPGHTPGSVCYLLERQGLRALFTGDVVQSLSLATPGALGTYTAYLPPRYRGNAPDYLATLRRLRAMPLPDLVLPGHPLMDAAPQNPHLTEERWHALLDQGIAEMERLQARFQTDGANFLDGTPRELLPGLHYLGDFGRRALYGLNTPKNLFLFDAPGGPGLVDFLARRFKELGWEGRKPTAVLLTSAEAEATAGLAALVRETGCQVVAPKAGLEAIRKLCPAGTAVLTAEGLEKSGWFEVRAIPLGGRGLAPVAYLLHRAGKAVLVSGRIPVKLSSASAEKLWNEVVTGPKGSVDQYLASLDRLKEVNPALWLPAVPVHGQNANLYDDEWAKVLAQNRQVMQMSR